MLKCKSAYDGWSNLERILSPVSTTQVSVIKEQLRTLKKLGTEMMQEYLVRVKGIVESLISTGETVSEGTLIDYILGGLGSEYHCVFTTVKSRGKTSFEELTDILISEENILKRMNNDTQVIAMTAHTTPFRGYGRGRSNYYQPRPYYNQPSYPHQQNAPIYPHQQFRGSNPNYYQPRPYLNQQPYFSSTGHLQ